MTHLALAVFLTISAIWPFGHRDRHDATGTIKDLDATTPGWDRDN